MGTQLFGANENKGIEKNIFFGNNPKAHSLKPPTVKCN